MKGQTHIILALIFALIVAVFAVINVAPVEVDYLFGTGQAPLVLVILVSVLMGGLITSAFGIFRLLQYQKQVRSLKKEIASLKNVEKEKDISTLDEQSADNNEINNTNDTSKE
ncbi:MULTISPECIES: lipopolysaccharide assembly LapA domain-containing protein [Paraliobacillus]|uniref:LapA family protein n=1 Tax=Paraliobacillus TaxID=200903 RepID=UPI000DD473A1|nr:MULTISPECIES: lipopolysaccharide assembly protein LapA domain-containing protein [Paraliobacillus]